MTTKQRNQLEELYIKYQTSADEYRNMLKRQNRQGPAKLFTERIAELALAKLGE